MAVPTQPTYLLAPLRTAMFDGPAAQPQAVPPATPPAQIPQEWKNYFLALQQHLQTLTAAVKPALQVPTPPLATALAAAQPAQAQSASAAASQLGSMTMPWALYFQNLSAALVQVEPIVGFIINTGATGTDVGPILPAARTGTADTLVVVIKASDASTPLSFTINQNQSLAITVTVPAGTIPFTLLMFTNFVTTPLAVNQNDLFSIDITSGSSSWMFTAVVGTSGLTS